MSDTKELKDEALENVTGGARRTVSNDSSSYSWVRSGPGKQYDEHIEDPVFVNALKGANKRVTYTPEREEALKKCGAKYEVKVCKSCGGKVKKIDIWLVEVV